MRSWLGVGLRLYRWLLYLYPSGFRRRFARAQFECVADLYRQAPNTVWRRVRFWIVHLTDLVQSVLAVHLEVRRSAQPLQGDPMLSEIHSDIRHGLRRLASRPGASAIVILTLAVGIGANTVVFSLLNSFLVRPLACAEPSRLMAVWPAHWMTAHELTDLQEGVPALDIAGSAETTLTLSRTSEARRVEGVRVTDNYFSVMGAPATLGVPLNLFDPEPTAVLSHAFWQRVLGADPDIVGSRLILDGTPHRVTAVMGATFPSLPLQGDIWVPMVLDPTTDRFRGMNEIQAVGRLRPGSSPEVALQQLQAAVRLRQDQWPDLHGERYGSTLTLESLQAAAAGDLRTPLLILQGCVLVVLLIACTNVVNLNLAALATRRDEMALRRALGAGNRRLLQQLTIEGLMVSSLGGVAALAVAAVGLPFLVALLPFETPVWLAIEIDGSVLAVTAFLTLIVAVVAGAVPALRLGWLGSNPILSGGRHTRSHRLQAWLVGAEVGAAVVLVISAGLLVRSFWHLIHVDAGFDTSRLVSMRLDPPAESYRSPGQRRLFYSEVLNRVEALAGVEKAGALRHLPLRGAWGTLVEIEGLPSPGDRGHSVHWTSMTSEATATLQWRVVAGRGFSASDRETAAPVALVNEAFVRRYLDGAPAVGRRIRAAGDESWVEIVGVVANVRQHGLDRGFSPMFFRPFDQKPIRSMYLVLRSFPAAQGFTAFVRGIVGDIDSDVPISETLSGEQLLASSLADSRLPAVAVGLFAGIALLLGCSGIYGTVSRIVGGQTVEIGLRRALGAGRGEVVAQIVRRGMRPIVIGIAAGLGLAVWSTRLLAGMLHGVSPIDPLTFVAVTLVTLLVALTACWLPARRASRVDPLTALRYE